MSTGTAMSGNLAAALIGELQHEAATTRTVLERIPADKFEYKPHDRSMAMGRLAAHIAEMTGWVTETVTKPELDFATMNYKPFVPETTEELVAFLDKVVGEAVEALKNTSDETMLESWTLRNGEQVYFTMPRIQVLRGMVFNHIVHHRGQLSVYMRLNDIPVPGIYGPSADEGSL